METISVAREFINSNDYLASVDLYQMLISASQFMNRIENFYGLSGESNLRVCLPSIRVWFSATHVYQGSEASIFFVKTNGMKACYYIDDTLVIAASKAECSVNVQKYRVLKTPWRPWFQNELQTVSG